MRLLQYVCPTKRGETHLHSQTNSHTRTTMMRHTHTRGESRVNKGNRERGQHEAQQGAHQIFDVFQGGNKIRLGRERNGDKANGDKSKTRGGLAESQTCGERQCLRDDPAAEQADRRYPQRDAGSSSLGGWGV